MGLSRTGHGDAAAIVAAVRRCRDTPFRPQGRVRGLGLDCVGVALVAADAAGLSYDLPRYRLSGDHAGLLGAVVGRLGLTACDTAAPGDIVVFETAPGRCHLAVMVVDGRLPQFVHAHAGLGRVVESPADPGWAVMGAWRLPEGD